MIFLIWNIFLQVGRFYNMKKICVFTGGRAEYGLLKPLLRHLQKSEKIKLQILVSGMHLCQEFGMTIKEITEDGFEISDTVEMVLSSDTPVSICKSIGLGLISYADSLKKLTPDMVITLGDRYENFSFCATAWTMRIPIAHIQGGEVTSGALDDQYRHCITKFARYHFTSTENYRKRVIQLGEDPDYVFNVGALNVESLNDINPISKTELEEIIGIPLNKNTILVTFHPATLDCTPSEILFQKLLNVISNEFKDLNIIFTKTLADTNGRIINHMIDDYVSRNIKAVSFASLGHYKYISVLHYIGAVVGNSSSGIIETASIPIATVDIGLREAGRIKPTNVLWSDVDEESISKSIKLALSNDFQNSVKTTLNPYYKRGTSKFICQTLENIALENTTMKRFYDVDFNV